MNRLDSKATTYLPFRNLKYLKAFTSLWNEICDIVNHKQFSIFYTTLNRCLTAC